VDRIPVGDEIFHIRPNCPSGPPASYAMDAGLFPGLKWAGRDLNYPHHSSVAVKERVDLYLQSLSVLSWLVIECI